MDHARTFLEAIRQAPDDDTPRLVFADWLEEHGGAPERARAAFIRAQVRAARLEEGDPHRQALEDEATELLAEHEEEWAGAVATLAMWWEFRRGFIECVDLRDRSFLDGTEQLFDAAPVRHVRLRVEPDMEAMAARPELAQVESLEFLPRTGTRALLGMGDGELRALVGSSHLHRLRSLMVRTGHIEARGIQALVSSRWIENLRKIDLADSRALGDRAARLLASAQAPNLEVLRLRDTNFSPVGIEALFASDSLPRLHSLDVNVGVALNHVGNPEATLRHLLSLPVGRQVSSLVICDAPQAAPALRALTAGPAPNRWKILVLGRLDLSPAQVRALVESPSVSSVERLELSENKVGDRGADALASSPHLARLRWLGLSNNHLARPGIAALASAPHLRSLRSLDLSGNFVGVTSLEALTASPLTLTHLSLVNVHLDPEGARVLAGSPWATTLRELNLSSNRLGDQGIALLAKSPHLGRLSSLAVLLNHVGQAGAQALARSPYLHRLRSVWLDQQYLGEEDKDLLRSHFGRALFRP